MSSKSKWIFFTFLVFALAGGWGAHQWHEQTSTGLFPYILCRLAFARYLHQDAQELAKEASSGESGVYYFTSYYLNGMLSAVEATGSERLLRRVMRVEDTMLPTAQKVPSHGKVFAAWGPFVITPQTDIPKPIAHYTLQAMVPIARTAAVIMRNDRFKTKYAVQAKRYGDFAEEAVVQYWYLDQFNRRVPWLDQEVPIWNDNATNMGLVATFLYEATGGAYDLEIARTVGQAFKGKLAPCGRGWVWESQTIPIGSDTDNTPGSVGNQAGVPDTSHTNREPILMVSLYEAGIMFNRDDISRMAYTLVDYIWNQSYDNPSFANYINGSDKPYRVYKEAGLNGPIYHGWVLVGGYEPQAQKVLLAALKAILAGKRNPSLVRNITGYGGGLALSGNLLRNWNVQRTTAS
jgi:hypothetical protein